MFGTEIAADVRVEIEAVLAPAGVHLLIVEDLRDE